MSAFMNKKMNIGISSSVSSGTQVVTGATDITLFNTNGFDVVAGPSPGIYLPTSSTIYLPKGFYYFVECSLKMYRGTNANYLDYAIVDSSNIQLSNTARVTIVTDTGEITYTYPKKAYAFIDCISSSKTIKIRSLLTYDITTSTSGSSLTINGNQGATSATNFVHSEPQSNIIIKSWKPLGYVNDNTILNSAYPATDSRVIGLTTVSQLTSSFLNKYALMFNTGGNYTYYMPVSPQVNDFVGFYFHGTTGSFTVRKTSTGTYLTGTSSINQYSIRKSFKFQWDGNEWIDIGEFNVNNIIYP